MTNIVLVDDHSLFRRGLRDLISESDKLTVVGEAGNYTQWAEVTRKTPYDALVLDLNLPGRSGMEILKTAIDHRSDLRVLVLSQHDEEQYGVRAIQAGALGFLRKDSTPRQILAAIESIADGKPYLSANLNSKLISSFRNRTTQDKHQMLSGRELQTLTLIAQGTARASIARSLCISPKTVSVYRSRILEKLGVDSNAALTAYAIEHCLI